MKKIIIDRLKDRSILILGFGKEGRSTYNFLINNGIEKNIDIGDLNRVSLPDRFDGELIYGENYQDVVVKYDIVIKSPGVCLDQRYLSFKNISSQTDLFLSAFRDQTIAITGTKGKTTTTSMVYHLLKSLGKDTLLAGNIGVPVLDIIDEVSKDTLVVMELSSHQLQLVSHSPNIGVLLNIFPEHLDYYSSYEAYIEAKKMIAKYQKNSDICYVEDSIDLSGKGEKIVLSDLYKLYKNRTFQLPILGEHNRLNGIVAMEVVKRAIDKDVDLVPNLKTFKGLEHRLEIVGTFKDITFINDSISTIPEAAIAAMESVKGEVGSIILGGKNRGDEIVFNKLVDYIIDQKIPHIILLPETGEVIGRSLEEKGFYNLTYVSSLEDGVRRSFKVTEKGKYSLLSPASSSYNMFRNFEERGKLFKEYLKRYGE